MVADHKPAKDRFDRWLRACAESSSGAEEHGWNPQLREQRHARGHQLRRGVVDGQIDGLHTAQESDGKLRLAYVPVPLVPGGLAPSAQVALWASCRDRKSTRL